MTSIVNYKFKDFYNPNSGKGKESEWIRTNDLSVTNPSVPSERGLLHIFASKRPATVSTNNSSELNNLSIFSFDLYFESVKRFMFSVVHLYFWVEKNRRENPCTCLGDSMAQR